MLLALLFAAQTAPIPPRLIPLDSVEGRAMLTRSKSNADFFALVSHFETQEEQSYCGVATATMALNALPLAAPSDRWAPWHTFTQKNVFTAQASLVKTADGAAHGGFTLDELAAFLQAHPVQVRVGRASESTLDAFRAEAAANLARDGDVVLVNFLRSALDQQPNGPIEKQVAGHWSPIAAYDDASDRFLMLDVARYKYPPLWIPAADLFAAMNTNDVASGRSRGWLAVSPGQGVPAPTPVKASAFLVRIAAGLFAAVFALGAAAGYFAGRRRAKRA